MYDSRSVSRPEDSGGSLIENILKVVPLPSANSNLFTNASPLWHPPDAQGIYGGICIAQSLNAAQATVSPEFYVHSLHGQFVLAGRADENLVYQVCIDNDGRSFATRTVKVLQNERTIFTAIISFAREMTAAGRKPIQHSEPMPREIPEPPYELDPGDSPGDSRKSIPYVNKKVGLVNINSNNPHEKCVHQWNKTSHRIAPCRGVHVHLAALAYICDSYFIGTIPHVHNIWDFVKPPLTEFDVGGPHLSERSCHHSRIPASDEEIDVKRVTLRIGMMVTLSHTMFFHAPRAVKADEWMLSELVSHWAGNGRGVATQKIWSKDGTLVATCVQEGIVRLAKVNSDPRQRSKNRL